MEDDDTATSRQPLRVVGIGVILSPHCTRIEKELVCTKHGIRRTQMSGRSVVFAGRRARSPLS
jgi:hypothetical protein